MAQINDFQLFIKVNKLKQKQVAEYLGTSTQYVNQVANGKCALSGDKYEMLAQSGWDVSMLDFPSYIKVPAAKMTPYPIEGAAPPILKGVQVTTDGNGVKIITAEPTLKGSRRAVQYAKRLKTQGKPFRFQAASAAPQINPNAVPVLLDPSAPDNHLTVAVPMAKPAGETSQIAQLTAQVDRLIDHLTTSQANISKLVESVEASGKRVDRLLNIIEKKL